MHWLSAWIFKTVERKEEKASNPKPLNLPEGFSILAAPEHDDLKDYETLAPPASNAALIITRYWGGVGDQYALLWLAGKIVDVKSKDEPINEALHKLGVPRIADCDEFDTLQLQKIRSTHDLHTTTPCKACDSSKMKN
jgi:hypothetical protein